MTIKHIYWFTHYNSICPSVRSRGEFPLKYLLAKYRISYSIFYPGYSLKNILYFISLYLKILFFRKPGSFVVIQKVYSNRFYAIALKILVLLRNNNTLYDIDDAEYLRHSSKSIRFFMNHCTYVSVGSNALKKYALQFNSNVFLNTSPVIDHSYLKACLSDKFTIGWVGDYGNGNKISYEFSHKRALNELIFPFLKEVTFPCRLILIGISKKQDIIAIRNYFSGVENIELQIPEFIDWTDEEWVYREISKFDIGLAPMINHEFNKAKSAYKVKQYLSCGVPVLGSSAGENANFILQGVNGFLCDLPEEYSRQIQYFAGLDKDKYFELSRNAYANSHLFRTRNYCEGMIKSLS